MSELMGIEIDPTCNQQAVEMNQIEDSMGKISYLNSPEYRKIRDEIIERFKGSLMAQYPEISDPYEYQKNERYLGLQVAEQILELSFAGGHEACAAQGGSRVQGRHEGVAIAVPQPQPQDYSAYESYGLTYHHFDQSDDVNRNFD